MNAEHAESGDSPASTSEKPGRRSDRSLYLFAAQGANVVLTFITYSYISRQLGTVEAVGEFTLARSVTLAFAYAADSLIRLVFVSALASRPDDSRALFGTAQSLQWLVSLASLPMLVAVIVLGGWSDLSTAIFAAGLAAVTQYGADLAAASLLARKRTDLAAAVLVADRLLMVVCVGVAMQIERSVAAAYLGMLAANLLRAAGSLVLARRIVLPSIRPGWSTEMALDLLRRGAPVALSLIAFAIYGRAAIFAMDKLSSDGTQQGLFAAAVTLLGLLNFIPTTFGLSELPTFGTQSADGLRAAQELHRRCFRCVMLASVATGTLLIVAARPIMSILFGKAFGDAAPLLQILMLSVPFGFMGHVYRYLLIPLRAQKLELAATAFGLALQMGLASQWIPRYQAMGAAAALLTAEVIVYAMKFALASQRIGGVGKIDGFVVPVLWMAGSLGLLMTISQEERWIRIGGQFVWLLAIGAVCRTMGRNASSEESAKRSHGRSTTVPFRRERRTSRSRAA